MNARVAELLERITPRQIVVAGFALFLIYAWPGFVGWDTLTHFEQARAGVYTDGHPPGVARLFRIVELFIAGPAGILLLQSSCVLLGLHGIFKRRVSPRIAALVAVFVFLFPPIAGVTAYVVKDSLMAGFLLVGVALLVDARTRMQRLAIVFMLLANMMRWNALAATFAPVILLFRWSPTIAGWRRYAVAFAMWFGVTATALVGNEVLTDEPEYLWSGSHAYQDIAGTLQYMPDQTDAQMLELFAGLRLRYHDNLHQRFRDRYNSADYRHIAWHPDRLMEKPETATERDAAMRAWKATVLAHPAAYFRYRWDNYKLLTKLDRPPSFSNVYVWFTVIAAPETVAALDHNATASRIQGVLRELSIKVSLTPIYFVFVYLGACFLMLALCWQRPLEAALCLSGIGYQLAWFFLAPTTDFRYSQWMIVCSVTAAALLALGRTRFALRPSPARGGEPGERVEDHPGDVRPVEP